MPELTVGAIRHLLKILDEADKEPWVHHAAQKGAGADQWITSGEDGVTVCEVLNHSYYCKPEHHGLGQNVGTYEQIHKNMRAIAEGHNALRPLLVALCDYMQADLEGDFENGSVFQGRLYWQQRGVCNSEGFLTDDGNWLLSRGWENEPPQGDPNG